ncbi:uncharacterized protein LOC116292973 [Actinia tenebrosa]|uniref:Uncharacterized protein LOC116292973 n=1 Tax=Actinia tenebrosa TaxID=6105 RepID=A0A6P8HMG7_ACTTE|nr:uncharacterized protein LOC116292973 [Actinia tenebrosa]
MAFWNVFEWFLLLFLVSQIPLQGVAAGRYRRQWLVPSYAGSSIELQCTFQNPKQTVTLWHFAGMNFMRRIKPNGVTVEQYGQRFVLHSITRVNNGMYMCREGNARVPLGQVYVMPAAIKDSSYPTIPTKRVVVTGSETSKDLTCTAKGQLISSVFWYKGKWYKRQNH